MGWNKPSVASTPLPTPKRKPTALRGAVAGFIVVAVAAVVAFVLFSGGDAKPKAKGDDRAGASKVRRVSNAAGDKRQAENQRRKSVGALDDSVVGKPLTNETKVVDVESLKTNKNVTVFKKPALKSSSDQLLAMTLSSNGYAPVPPVPRGAVSEADFRKSLETPIEILDTDSDRVREVKERVIAAREEMKARLANGEKFDDVISEYRQNELENFKVRNNAMAELNEIIQSGDTEGAQKYVDTINLCLQQMGIKQLKIPNKMLKKGQVLKTSRTINKQN